MSAFSPAPKPRKSVVDTPQFKIAKALAIAWRDVEHDPSGYTRGFYEGLRHAAEILGVT